MTDLDPRIARALENLPDADPEARARARQQALDALPQTQRAHRPRWKFAIAAALGATLLAGTALAVTDRIDLRLGKPTVERTGRPVREQPLGEVTVPSGAKGVAVVAGGRLWLKTASGLGVQGLAVTTAELSPNALYVAVGIDQALVAMAPDGRLAWTHATGGRVVAVSWAPNPIVVAYVVKKAQRFELHVIEGNGDNDQLVDPDVSNARPSWRADTLALAYIDADGRARVVDYPSLASRRASTNTLDSVAYSPRGNTLVRVADGPLLTVGDAATSLAPFVAARLVGLVWPTSDFIAIVGDEKGQSRLWTLRAQPQLIFKAKGSSYAPQIDALAAIPTSGRLAVGVPVGAERQVWEVAAPEVGTDLQLEPKSVLVRLPASAGTIEVISIR